MRATEALSAQDCPPALIEEEPHVGGSFTDDDIVGIYKASAVHVYGEIAGGEPGERAMDAPRELVVRSARAKGFAHGVCEQVANSQWRGERKGARAADCDGVEVERNLHADHCCRFIFCRIEELPADEDK